MDMEVTNLSEYFFNSQRRFGKNKALIFGGDELSYDNVFSLVQETCFLIKEINFENRSSIATLALKKTNTYVNMLSILATNNIYVPINPNLGVDRITHIIKTANVEAILVDAYDLEDYHDLINSLPKDILVLNTSNTINSPTKFIDSNVMNEFCDLHSTAYILFTSGSSGQPKSVHISHYQAKTCIENTHSIVKTDENDLFSQFSELSFDVSIGEIFLCWKSGSTLCVPNFKELMLPITYVKKNQITVWSSVPTLVNNLIASGLMREGIFQSVKWNMFCGEALTYDLVNIWSECTPNAITFNIYGPTEATIFTSYYKVEKQELYNGIVPIGKPFKEFKYKILHNYDDKGNELKSGELLLAGPQVISCYLNNKNANNKSFMKHDNTEWYMTGDIVSESEDKGLIYHGRVDRQVKLRGHRVELLEIESLLSQFVICDGVAVIPIYNKGICEKIVGFYSNTIIKLGEIHSILKSNLPKYMCPEEIIILNKLPLNSNGKVDYMKLLNVYEEIKGVVNVN